MTPLLAEIDRLNQQVPSTLAEIATLNEGESSPRPDEREIAP